MITTDSTNEVGSEAGVRAGALDLLETDNRYFELASQTRKLCGGQLTWMPGCTAMPLGCVILRTKQPADASEAQEWIHECEEAVRQIDGELVRIYVQHPSPILEDALEQSGYDRRIEFALLSPPTDSRPTAGVGLRRISSVEEMDEKCRYDSESQVGPDRHELDPALWRDAMHRKWRTQQLTFFFIERQGEVCGTIGSMKGQQILRLKNLAIRPDYRRRGLGREAALALRQLAYDSSCLLGTFGVEESGGLDVYLRAGLRVAAQQHEWTKRINDR